MPEHEEHCDLITGSDGTLVYVCSPVEPDHAADVGALLAVKHGADRVVVAGNLVIVWSVTHAAR